MSDNAYCIIVLYDNRLEHNNCIFLVSYSCWQNNFYQIIFMLCW